MKTLKTLLLNESNMRIIQYEDGLFGGGGFVIHILHLQQSPSRRILGLSLILPWCWLWSWIPGRCWWSWQRWKLGLSATLTFWVCVFSVSRHESLWFYNCKLSSIYMILNSYVWNFHKCIWMLRWIFAKDTDVYVINSSFLRMLRIIRISRLARVARIMRSVPEVMQLGLKGMDPTDKLQVTWVDTVGIHE